jgi:cell division protease FtsH
MALGGRAAEEIVFGKISTGAQNDLERITKMAYAMITIYGMNEKVGNVSFYDPQQEYSFQKPYSEETAKMIDEEVRSLIGLAFIRTKELLSSKREQLEKLAQELLRNEILFHRIWRGLLASVHMKQNIRTNWLQVKMGRIQKSMK